MSKKLKHITEEIEKQIRKDMFELTHCLVGTIIYTLGKIQGLENKDICEIFRVAKNDDGIKFDNVEDYVTYVKDTYFPDLVVSELLYLVYDERGIFTPAVVSDKFPTISTTGITPRYGYDPYIKREELYSNCCSNNITGE